MAEDLELLRQFVRAQSQDAFVALVERHIGAVYGVALRQARGDTHLAEDIAQIVFSTLARKAPTLLERPVLGGWLYRTTRFAARDVIRTESRRRKREQEAVAMNELSAAPDDEIDPATLRLVVDDAMVELKDAERDAVWMRFFEARSFAEIGARLRITENAARMRVERALDLLHAALSRRGIRSSTAAVAVALANQPVVAVPAGLGVSVATAAVAASGVGAMSAAAGLAALFTMSKIKMAVAGVIVLAVSLPVAVELRANRALRDGLRERDGEHLAAPQRENQRLTAALAERGGADVRLAEIARLRARVATLAARPEGVLDSELRPASAHRNVGRATPEAAHETLVWALLTRDLDALASFVVFAGDPTPAEREAFMARFGEAVRAKYRTPERLCAAVLFGTDGEVATTPIQPEDAFQFLGTDDHVGGDGTRYGQVRLRAWSRTAAGVEREVSFRVQLTPTGYALGALFLSDAPRRSDDASALVRERVDLRTGGLIPVKR